MTTYLCGIGDRGQLQVLRVAPAKEAAVSWHGQAAVPIGGHLDDVHSGQVSTQPGGRAGDIVVTQAWHDENLCYSNPCTDLLCAKHSFTHFAKINSESYSVPSAHCTASCSRFSKRKTHHSDRLHVKPLIFSKPDSSWKPFQDETPPHSEPVRPCIQYTGTSHSTALCRYCTVNK